MNKTYRRIKRFIRSCQHATYFKRTPFTKSLQNIQMSDYEYEKLFSWDALENFNGKHYIWQPTTTGNTPVPNS